MNDRDDLFRRDYEQLGQRLRAVAASLLADERSLTTIQTTHLVDEALEDFFGLERARHLRRAGLPSDAERGDRDLTPAEGARFIGVVVLRMRNDLRDRKDRKSAVKRGRDWTRVDVAHPGQLADPLELFDAPELLVALLDELAFLESCSPESPAVQDPRVTNPKRAARAYALHAFGRIAVREVAAVLEAEGGKTVQEIAATLDASVVTVRKDLAEVRAWLAHRLGSRD